MKKKTAIIFIGIQAGGKSTFYREQFSELVHINLDTLKTRKKENKLLTSSASFPKKKLSRSIGFLERSNHSPLPSKIWKTVSALRLSALGYISFMYGAFSKSKGSISEPISFTFPRTETATRFIVSSPFIPEKARFSVDFSLW